MDYKELLTVIGASIGLFVSIFALIRLLIEAYFKKAKELEKEKKTRQREMLNELKETVEEHKKSLRSLESAMGETKAQLQLTNQVNSGLSEKLDGYIKENEFRLKKMKSEIIELSKAFVMIKEVKNGAKKN